MRWSRAERSEECSEENPTLRLDDQMLCRRSCDEPAAIASRADSLAERDVVVTDGTTCVGSFLEIGVGDGGCDGRFVDGVLVTVGERIFPSALVGLDGRDF